MAIVGESGSGKSVTARSLVGLNGREAIPAAAALWVDGRDALDFSQRDRRAVRVVERGDVDEVFEAPSHPYTRELPASLPGQGLRAS